MPSPRPLQLSFHHWLPTQYPLLPCAPPHGPQPACSAPACSPEGVGSRGHTQTGRASGVGVPAAREQGAAQGKGWAPSSLLTIWRKRRMRWASCARNTCHTLLTWLPGDQSPSPSRPERKSEGESRLRGAQGRQTQHPPPAACPRPFFGLRAHLSVHDARRAVGLQRAPGH